jgi:hypothetical protein
MGGQNSGGIDLSPTSQFLSHLNPINTFSRMLTTCVSAGGGGLNRRRQFGRILLAKTLVVMVVAAAMEVAQGFERHGSTAP